MSLKRAMMIGLDSADPVQVKRLINEGKMPNLKKLLENGAANENLAMLGCLPSVTPPNWCSIATGAWPRTHGITCYNNQTLGKSLKLEELNWMSTNVEAEFIWEAFSKSGKRNIMLNYCEAWPPRLENDAYGIYIDGTGATPFLRCNIDYQKAIFLEEGDFKTTYTPHKVKDNNTDCVIMADQYEEMKQSLKSSDIDIIYSSNTRSDDMVTAYPSRVEDFNAIDRTNYNPEFADKLRTPIKEPTNWAFKLPNGAKEATIFLAQNTIRRFVILSASDGRTYDTATIYKSKKEAQPIGTVKDVGNWSEWIYDIYLKDDEERNVAYKVRICDLVADGSSAVIFVSHTTDLDNENEVYPKGLLKDLYKEIGPMMPFCKTNVRGDKKENERIAIETYGYQMMAWHANASHWLFNKYPDWQLFYVHLHIIDSFQHWYVNNILPGTSDDPQHYRDLIDEVYAINDYYIGEMMQYLDDDTVIFVTSDHGCIPHSAGDDYVGMGAIGGTTTRILGDLGYTVTYRDDNCKLQVDWTKTKAVAMRSSHIYINLKGRNPEGIVEQEEYTELVSKIIGDLYNYREPNTGKRVISFALTGDEMEYVGMGGDHCGDIFYCLMPTWCCEHANVLPTVHHEGWSMQNLCIMGGNGIKKGELFKRPIRITDIVPTICYLTDTPMPAQVEGGLIYQALEETL